MAATCNAGTFYKFGLLVTGEGERNFAPRFFRSLMDSGNCRFTLIRKINQRSPISSPRRKARMVGSGKEIPNRDSEEIGFPARQFLDKPDSFVIILDDLEKSRVGNHQDVFCRYRTALDRILDTPKRSRAEVHFFLFDRGQFFRRFHGGQLHSWIKFQRF